MSGLGLGFTNLVGTGECWMCVCVWVAVVWVVYLSVTDIANPDLFACSCRTWISLDISRLMKSSDSQPAVPHVHIASRIAESEPP